MCSVGAGTRKLLVPVFRAMEVCSVQAKFYVPKFRVAVVPVSPIHTFELELLSFKSIRLSYVIS